MAAGSDGIPGGRPLEPPTPRFWNLLRFEFVSSPDYRRYNFAIYPVRRLRSEAFLGQGLPVIRQRSYGHPSSAGRCFFLAFIFPLYLAGSGLLGSASRPAGRFGFGAQRPSPKSTLFGFRRFEGHRTRQLSIVTRSPAHWHSRIRGHQPTPGLTHLSLPRSIPRRPSRRA